MPWASSRFECAKKCAKIGCIVGLIAGIVGISLIFAGIIANPAGLAVLGGAILGTAFSILGSAIGGAILGGLCGGLFYSDDKSKSQNSQHSHGMQDMGKSREQSQDLPPSHDFTNRESERKSGDGRQR